MFNKSVKIGEGQKYDTTKVSTEGITAEERALIEKNNRKMIDIFKAFDVDGDGNLNKFELAMAMDAFSKMDNDGEKDGKLSKKELEKGAELLNEQYKDLGLNIDSKGLRSFLKNIRKFVKNDEKVSTQSVLDEHVAEELKAKAEADKLANAQKEAELKAKAEAEAKEKAEAEAKAKIEAEKARLATPSDYTIQKGERLDDLLKRSLEAQGKEVNEENLADAKAEFIKNNPGALHGPKGKEYLYMGDVVKIPGALEDKANANEIKAEYRAAQAAKQAEAEAKAKAEAEAKAKAKAEADAKAKAEADAEARRMSMKGNTVTERDSTYVAPTVVPGSEKVKAATPAKNDPKKLEAMKKWPIKEHLPNGYSRRDVPGYADAYFDKDGNRISKDTYLKARGKKDRKVDYMVQHTVLEELPNGYTKRDKAGPGVYYFDKDGNPVSKEAYERAKKSAN